MESGKHSGTRLKHKTKCDFLRILCKSNNDPQADSALEEILENENLAEKDIIKLIQVYLERGNDQNGNNKNEKKVLHVAFSRKMRNAVDLLTRKFSYLIDKLDEKGDSVTHHFVKYEKQKFLLGQQRLFKLLKTPGFHELTQMYDAKTTESETASFVEWLIEKGFDFDRQNNEGKSALLLCIEYNLQHISVVLLKHSRQIHSQNQHLQSLLYLFFEKNAEHRNECRSDERIFKWYDTYNSRYAIDIVKILLDKGISAVALDIWNRSPLYVAIKERENKNIVDLLIDHSLQTNDFATKVLVELLKCCAWWGEWRTNYFVKNLRNLTSKGADVNVKAKNGTTPAYWAFQAKNHDAINFLNEHGADFSAITEIGENLFHALAKKTEISNEPKAEVQENLVDFLANKSCCDVNAKTRTDEETPLHLASESGNFVIVRKLVEHGAEINCKNTSGETPLHLSVHSYSAQIAEFLLSNKADVNSKDVYGRWPLYLASTSERCLLLVPLLLQWGAYVNAKIAGESPFSRAIKINCLHNAREMLAYGADINDDCVIELLPSRNDKYTELQILLMQHWIKLNTAELPASKKYADIVNFEEHEKFYNDCSEEVERLKGTFINNRTSIYAFLHMDFDRRRGLIDNKNLKTFINSWNVRAQFPKYAVVISASYRETVLWKSLLKPAERGWIKFTGRQLPEELLQIIFAHLRNADLLGMIE